MKKKKSLISKNIAGPKRLRRGSRERECRWSHETGDLKIGFKTLIANNNYHFEADRLAA